MATKVDKKNAIQQGITEAEIVYFQNLAGKIEIDVNERAVFIRTQGCFFVYTNSDCFLNS